MKELTKDILFMVWGFVGGGIAWFCLFNTNLHYVTGSFLDVGHFLNKWFIGFGFGFFALLICLCVYRKYKIDVLLT